MSESTPNADGRKSGRRGTARDRIIASAIDLFYRDGYEATAVQDVVDRAGVTKGSFYHHFSSKDELLLLIHDRFTDAQLAEVEQIRASGREPEVQLRELLVFLAVSTADYQREEAIFFEQRRFLSEERFAEVRAKRDTFESHMLALIREGMEQGRFVTPRSPRIVAFGILGLAAWGYQWYRPNGDLSPHEIGDLNADLVLSGLQPRG
jgi:TetR/AcrR family transcriptional regulator, cholesterol catabolism regulator